MSKIGQSLCTDCPNPETHLEGTCPTHQIDTIIANIKAQIQRPSSRALTSREMRAREDRRRSMATSVLLAGGEVREDYR